MSTRAGKFVRLRDLTDELGRDVVRYFMVARKPESHLQFDLELARAESLDNPVYYIQYAHTRIASIFRKADLSAFDAMSVDLSPLETQAEFDLILADYTLGLARAFHAYYGEHRVIDTDEKLMLARLALLQAIRIVFRRSLEILGISSPEAM